MDALDMVANSAALAAAQAELAALPAGAVLERIRLAGRIKALSEPAPEPDPLSPEGIALMATRIRLREAPGYSDPRIDTVLAREVYLQRLAVDSPAQAAAAAAAFRSDASRFSDLTGTSPDNIGVYARLIEDQLALAPAPSALNIPTFKTYAQAQEWVERKSRQAGGKLKFAGTEEYKAAYPQISALFKAESESDAADALALLGEAGLAVGDRVYSYTVGMMGTAGSKITGTIGMLRGAPVVKTDAPQTVSRGGKLSTSSTLPWGPEWRKEGTTTNPLRDRMDRESDARAAAARAAADARDADFKAEMQERARKVAALQAEHGTLTDQDVEVGDVLEDVDGVKYVVLQKDHGRIYGDRLDSDDPTAGSMNASEFRKTGDRDPEGAVLIVSDDYDRVKVINGVRVPVAYDHDANDYVPINEVGPSLAMDTATLDSVVVIPLFDAVGLIERMKLTGEIRSLSLQLSDLKQAGGGVLEKIKLTGQINAILAKLGAATAEQKAPADELSDDPNSPNYRYKDTGYIADSRKERAALQIKQWAAEGRSVKATEIDWDAIEQNPRAAALTITKSNLFGQTDWEKAKSAGMEPGTAFLIDRVYASIAPAPAETAAIKGERLNEEATDRIASYDGTDPTTRRKDYAVALSTIRERLEVCIKPDEVVAVLDGIRDELMGAQLNAEEADEVMALRVQYKALNERKRLLDEQKRQLGDAILKAGTAASSAKYENEKRERRGWKRDPGLDAIVAESAGKIEEAKQALSEWEAAHPEFKETRFETKLPGGGVSARWSTPLRDEMDALYQKIKAVESKARKRNIASSPVTRGWMTFGERFFKLLHFRSFKGSDAFMSHLVSVKNGRVKDWSWSEKERIAVARVGEAKVAFQLEVVDSHERIGGRPVKPESTQALQDMMGFRAIQSGNWVLKDPESARFHIEQTAGAMFDMADMLGINEKALGLGGRLAMAFGARGRGGKNAARAHYEPVERVINLTKMGGGGTLAHEYFHAVDNMLSELATQQPGKKDQFATSNPDVLPEGALRGAMRAVQDAMLKGTVRQPEIITLKAGAKALAIANVDRNTMYAGNAATAIKAAGNATDAVIAIDNIFSGRSAGSKNHKTWRMIAAAYYHDAGTTEVTLLTGPMGSSYLCESVKLDDGEAGKYWSQTEEMGARAFQSYMEDKLAAAKRRNDYLSAMADNKFYVFSGSKPFPEGEERARINAAFDAFFASVREAKVFEKASGNAALMDSIFGPFDDGGGMMLDAVADAAALASAVEQLQSSAGLSVLERIKAARRVAELSAAAPDVDDRLNAEHYSNSSPPEGQSAMSESAEPANTPLVSGVPAGYASPYPVDKKLTVFVGYKAGRAVYVAAPNDQNAMYVMKIRNMRRLTRDVYPVRDNTAAIEAAMSVPGLTITQVAGGGFTAYFELLAREKEAAAAEVAAKEAQGGSVAPIKTAVAPMLDAALIRAEQEVRQDAAYILAHLAEHDNDIKSAYPHPEDKTDRYQIETANEMRQRAREVTQRDPKRQSAYGSKGSEYVVPNQAAIDSAVQKAKSHVTANYEAFVAKLNSKIGPVLEASAQGYDAWSSSLLTVKTVTGEIEKWRTNVIINRSSLGTLFNQWPTRKVK